MSILVMTVKRNQFILLLLVLSALPGGLGVHSPSKKFPYREAGLSDRQAVAHLLNRFTFGPRPGDIDRVVALGPEQWLEKQMKQNRDEPAVVEKLKSLGVLNLSIEEIAKSFPNAGLILTEAYREGVITREDSAGNRAETRRKVEEFMKTNGYRAQRELLGALMVQKVERALLSEHQLTEVMTDFWFNHFNVSITDNQARSFVLSYERDAIRPYVFGKFGSMLVATAKHPAMLLYLDNARSTAPEGTRTTMGDHVEKQKNQPGLRGAAARKRIDNALTEERERRDRMMSEVPEQFRPRKGINENYARELMELHTLGVDGGYTQEDVVSVARAFTGWTVMPMGQKQEQLRKRIEKGKGVGFIQEGGFLFRADGHDATEKRMLGQKFPAGGGKEEGERVLELLSRHPSTAKHIATKLSKRFVSDDPPQSLVERLARVFLETDGDIRAMIRTIAESPEFWAKEARQAKIKSPLKLVVSSLRALDAAVSPPRAVIQWIARMGEPLYACQPPTGYPDDAAAWVNSGSLLQRMNFGLNLALGSIPGVTVDLSRLTNGKEPESLEAALEQYAAVLLPERDVSGTLKLLKPAVHDPEFAGKVSAATPYEERPDALGEETMEESSHLENPGPQGRRGRAQAMIQPPTNQSPLAQVLGVILGSPEFQRH